MPEFYEQVELPAARLSYEDLTALGRLMCDDLRTEKNRCKFSLSAGNAQYTACSIDGLMAQDLPQSVDGLWFDVSCFDDAENIHRAIWVSANREYAKLSARSSDYVWLHGKIKQVENFFVMRKRWYGKYRLLIGSLISGILGLLLFIWLVSALEGKLALAFICFVVSAPFGIALHAWFNGRLFPSAEINLSEKQARLSRETMMLFFAGVAAVGTVAAFLLQLLDTAR